jgi:hypothetical protein
VQYRFKEADRSWTSPQPTTNPGACIGEPQVTTYIDYGQTTAWRVAEIKNNVTKSKITFSYSSNTHIDAREVNQISAVTIMRKPPNYSGPYPLQIIKEEVHSKSMTEDFFVKEIVSDNYKVSFILSSRSDGGVRIAEVRIYSKLDLSTPVKTIRFTHEYFGDTSNPKTCWLKLKKVNLDGGGDNSEYQFSYVNEYVTNLGLSKQSLGIDYWGYCRGATGGATLLPNELRSAIESEAGGAANVVAAGGISFVERSPDFNYAKLFALEQTKYPTKGFTKITYEAADLRGGIRVASQEDFDGKQSMLKYFVYDGDRYPYDYGLVTARYGYNRYETYQCCVRLGSLYPESGEIDYQQLLAAHSTNTTYTADVLGSSDFIADNEYFYSFVTEYIGTPEGKAGRTEYTFNKVYDHNYSSKVLLTSKTDFAFGNSNFISRENYYYNAIPTKTINFWRLPEMLYTGVFTNGCFGYGSEEEGFSYTTACCPADPLSNYYYMLGDFVEIDNGIDNVSGYWIRLDSTVTTRDNVRQAKLNGYRQLEAGSNIPKHTNVISTEEKLSDNRSQKTEFYYPGDVDPDNANNTLGIPEMWNRENSQFKYYTSPVVKTRTSVENTLIRKETNYFSYDATNNIIVRSGLDIFPSGNDNFKTKWNFQYDSKGNAIKIAKDNGAPTVFVWGYNSTLPVIKVEGVDNTVLNSAVLQATSSMEQLLVNVGDMTTDAQKQTWKTFNNQLKSSLPPNTNFATFTFRPLLGITSQTDSNGISAYYIYDEFGRIKFIKDTEGNIIKAYSYHYKE